jgi:predicted GNAT family acetyltransferase
MGGMSDPSDVTVSDNPDKRRYEASVDSGVVAGFAEYRLRDGVIVFTHTEVDMAFEGQGIGSTLVREALDDARDRGLKVRPLCPFFKSYIERHREYAELVTS